MELKKHYFHLKFNNGQEFFIEDEETDTDKFITLLRKSGLFSAGNGFIKVKLERQKEPMNLREDQLFSIQKVDDGMVGNSSKVWKLV